MKNTFFAVCFVVLFAFGTADAQVYKWVDPATGRTVYSDTPPPGDAKNVNSSGKRPASADVDPVTGLPFAVREASRKFPVVLYTSPDCDICTQARALFNKRSVPFREIVIQTEDDRTAMKNLVGDTRVPSLFVGRQKINGYNEAAYNNALDLAGYPKSETPAPESGTKAAE